jgi:L-amino acid N-acyltransferase YncA
MIIRDARPEDAEAIAAPWTPAIRETAMTFNSGGTSIETMTKDIAARHALCLTKNFVLVGGSFSRPMASPA